MMGEEESDRSHKTCYVGRGLGFCINNKTPIATIVTVACRALYIIIVELQYLMLYKQTHWQL